MGTVIAMTPACKLLALSLLLLAGVSARAVNRNQRDGGGLFLGYPSVQAYAPRRFIKISKRGPIWTDFPLLELVHLTPSQPLPSPFHSVVQQQQQEEEEEEEEQFRRSLRNN